MGSNNKDGVIADFNSMIGGLSPCKRFLVKLLSACAVFYLTQKFAWWLSWFFATLAAISVFLLLGMSQGLDEEQVEKINKLWQEILNKKSWAADEQP